jgi:Notch-like protein
MQMCFIYILDCSLEGTCVTGECQISFEAPGFECLCHSGNYGPRCELYNPCVLTPCQNGATCRNFTDSTYECQCPEGFDGENCVVPIGPPCLHEEPCLNNGTCAKYERFGQFGQHVLIEIC